MADNLTLVYAPGRVDAALYQDGKLVDSGHTEDLMDRLVTRLGVTIEEGDIVIDRNAPGWRIAPTLDQVKIL